MNFVMLTVVLAILVTPVLFALNLHDRKNTYKLTKYVILDEIIKSIFISFIFHLITLKVVNLFGYNVDFEFIKKILFSNQLESLDLTILINNYLEILIYFFMLFLITFFSILLIKTLFLINNIKTNQYLKNNNFWFYLLSGNILNFKEYNKSYKDIKVDNIIKCVDVMTKGENNICVLYRGILIE